MKFRGRDVSNSVITFYKGISEWCYENIQEYYSDLSETSVRIKLDKDQHKLVRSKKNTASQRTHPVSKHIVASQYSQSPDIDIKAECESQRQNKSQLGRFSPFLSLPSTRPSKCKLIKIQSNISSFVFKKELRKSGHQK